MPVRVKPKSKAKTKATPKPKPKPPDRPTPPSIRPLPPPVTATVLQGVDGIWAVDVAISHGDLTVVRINGRAVWLGTP